MKEGCCSKGDAILLQEVYCKPFNSLPVHFILPRPIPFRSQRKMLTIILLCCKQHRDYDYVVVIEHVFIVE